jgi:hypothetical protein
MEAYKLTGLTPLGRHEARERRQQLGGWKRSSTPTPSFAQRDGCHTANRREDWPAHKRADVPVQAADGLLEIDRIWFRAHPGISNYVRPAMPDEFYPPFRLYCPPDQCCWVSVRRHHSKAMPARQPLAVPVGQCPFTEDGQ